MRRFVKRASDAQVYQLAKLVKRAGFMNDLKAAAGKIGDKTKELYGKYDDIMLQHPGLRSGVHGSALAILTYLATLGMKNRGLALGLTGGAGLAGIGTGLGVDYLKNKGKAIPKAPKPTDNTAYAMAQALLLNPAIDLEVRRAVALFQDDHPSVVAGNAAASDPELYR